MPQAAGPPRTAPAAFSGCSPPREASFAIDKKKVLLLSAGHFSCDINSGALPVVIPYLQEAYALSYQATGGIMFAYSLLTAITQPFFGLLSDRFSKPWLIPLGVLLAGCGLAFTGLVSSYWSVLVLVALGGIGSALFHPPAAQFANRVAGSQKGLALSLFSIGGNAGFVIGPLLGTAILGLCGLSGTLFFAFLALATVLTLSYCIGHMDRVAAPGTGTGARTAPLRDNNWKQFGRLTGAIITRTVVLSSIHAYLPLYWMHTFQQSKTAGALAVTLFGVFGVASNIVGGMLSDRWGQGRVLRLAFVPLAPALLLFSLASSEGPAWIMLLFLGFSLYFGFSSMVVLGQQFLARNIGFASGVTLGLNTAMGGICAPIIGWIGDHWGLGASFQVLAALALLGTILTFFIDASANAEQGSVNAA